MLCNTTDTPERNSITNSGAKDNNYSDELVEEVFNEVNSKRPGSLNDNHKALLKNLAATLSQKQ